MILKKIVHALIWLEKVKIKPHLVTRPCQSLLMSIVQLLTIFGETILFCFL